MKKIVSTAVAITLAAFMTACTSGSIVNQTIADHDTTKKISQQLLDAGVENIYLTETDLIEFTETVCEFREEGYSPELTEEFFRDNADVLKHIGLEDEHISTFLDISYVNSCPEFS